MAADSRRVLRGLARGAPVPFVAGLAAVVLGGILYTVADRGAKEPRGYAEFTLFRNGCRLESERGLNAVACRRIGRGAYLVNFRRSLAGSTVIASRGSCCPGRIGASLANDTTVLVAVEPRVRTPIRGSVVVP